MLSLIVHRGAEAWRPSPAHLAALQRYFSDVDGTIHLWPRSEANRVVGRSFAPYAFRGFTRGSVSHLFADATETPDSIAWLMAHELCHHQVHQDRELLSDLNRARPRDLEPASDRFHQLDPHELYCDGIATNLLGYRTDRAWWRARTPETQSATGLMIAHRYGWQASAI